jgi:DNA repair exonuclease SbcCD ATPase subunit
MLKEARIHCFQSWEDIVLKFGPGINIIVGEGNDIGKTALLRAIEWPVTNRPLGDGFISNFQDGPATVELITDTADVKRVKGDKVNQYILTAGEFEEEVFTAFGSNPPEVVREALNIQDVNIQKQQALPFLVLDPPGQVAQHIREIAKLDDIDKVIDLLKSKARTTKEQIQVWKDSVEEYDTKLAALAKVDIDYFESMLEKAQKVETDIQEENAIATALSSLVDNLKEIENTWVDFPDTIEETLTDTEAALKSNEEHVSRVNALEVLIKNLRQTEQEEIHLPDNLDSKLSKVEDAKVQYNNTVAKISDLSSLIEQLKKLDKAITKTQKEEEENQEAFDALLDQLVECPVCSSKLVDSTREHLLETYKDERTEESG